ncbi:helix-turn-helix domain-containing protein, partial [Desulfomarina sp.]
WPGNVRELRNLAERYVLLGHQFDYSLERLLSGQDKDQESSLPKQVECFERSLIEQALTGANGSIKEAMSTLAIPRKTLYDKMRKYGLDKSDYK